MRVGIYTRVSLDRDGTHLAVDRQESACREEATRRGWDVAEVYSDNDVSASKGLTRPGYERLLSDLETKRVDGVITYAWDRLTRRMNELVPFLDLQRIVQFEVVTLSGTIDLSTSAGRTMAYIMGGIAEGEADRIGERTSAQKAQRASLGIPHKGRTRQFGYDADWNEIETEASLIKEAFTRRASGESTNAIANDFISRGVRGVSGAIIRSNSLGKILSNPIYKGRVTFKGQEVADSIYGAIVDPVVWEQAQTHIASSSRGTNARRYLLSGIAVCGECFTEMKGNPNGMYRCAQNYGGCGKKSVSIKIADRWALWATMNNASGRAKTPVERPRDFQVELDALAIEIDRVREMTRSGIYSVPEGAAEVKELNAKMRELTREQALATPRQNRVTQTYLDFHRMNLSQQRAFIGEYITNIKVGPSISRGNQPFNPARFEFTFTDGTVYVPVPEDYRPDFEETQES